MPPVWLLCLLLSPVLCKSKFIRPPPTTSTTTTSSPAPSTVLSDDTLGDDLDQELELPPPSLLQSLYDKTIAVIETPWTDNDTASRQGDGMMGVGTGIRITVNLFTALLTAFFGMVGFGSVGLLAAKALAVGTLALFLTALGALKKYHKEGQGGQTVHYVPIQHGHHHDFFHERRDNLAMSLPPYLDHNER